MTFRLRQIEFTADGREIVRERVVDKARLSIGRAAENDIHLPDLAVDPQHATIAQLDDTRLEVSALGSLGFSLDGTVTLSGAVDIRTGAELRFGNYIVAAARADDGAALLTVRQAGDLGGKSADFDEKRGFSLAAVLPGKRRMSWLAAFFILALFLAFPIVSQLTKGDDPKATVHGDGSWSAGKLSLAHHGLEQKCEACHVKPFEPVQDKACVACHTQVHDHADPARMAAGRGAGPLGQRILWSVAHAFGKPGPGACTDCHTEHEGATRMAAPAQQFCSDCHGALKENLADTRLGDAGDFGKLHPQFTPAIVTDPLTRKLATVSLDAKPRENSGLAFTHAMHLDPRGGVARMAANIGAERGYGANGMQCKDCHRPTEDGIRFKPIDMERDCEGCHSLAYDQVGGTFRRLRHGDVDQMVADLSAADMRRVIPVSRRRPGDFAPGRPYYSNFAPPSFSGGLVQQAMSKGGVCGECHTPAMANGKLGVVPVTLVSRYMRNGWFNHKAHAQETCTSCHAANTSNTSADVLLPGIAQCRTCHLGEDSTKAAVPSGCAMCHSYHPTAGVPRRFPQGKT